MGIDGMRRGYPIQYARKEGCRMPVSLDGFVGQKGRRGAGEG